MKILNHFIGLVCAAVLLLPFAGCSDSGGDTPPEVKVLKLVPSEGTVRTGETVTFTVWSGEEDVTTQARIRNLKTDAYLDGAFVAEESGVYGFAAEMDGQVSKTVAVTVIAPFEKKGTFYRKVLVQKYTATWCGFCPQMTAALAKLDEEVPNRMVVMAIHTNDSFSITDGERLVSDFKISSIPRAVFDYRVMTDRSPAELKNALDGELKDYPAVCGIAATSKVEGNQIVTEAKIRIAESGKYRVCCAVIEDNLQFQGGSSADGYYHHVLRKFATPRIGEALGDCEAGMEYPCAYSIPVGKEWDLANCSVLFYVMKEESAEAVYTNNVVSCAAGKGACEYQYETE